MPACDRRTRTRVAGSPNCCATGARTPLAVPSCLDRDMVLCFRLHDSLFSLLSRGVVLIGSMPAQSHSGSESRRYVTNSRYKTREWDSQCTRASPCQRCVQPRPARSRPQAQISPQPGVSVIRGRSHLARQLPHDACKCTSAICYGARLAPRVRSRLHVQASLTLITSLPQRAILIIAVPLLVFFF